MAKNVDCRPTKIAAPALMRRKSPRTIVFQIPFVQDVDRQAKRGWRDDPLPSPAVLVNLLFLAVRVWLQYSVPARQQLLVDCVQHFWRWTFVKDRRKKPSVRVSSNQHGRGTRRDPAGFQGCVGCSVRRATNPLWLHFAGVGEDLEQEPSPKRHASLLRAEEVQFIAEQLEAIVMGHTQPPHISDVVAVIIRGCPRNVESCTLCIAQPCIYKTSVAPSAASRPANSRHH